MNQFDVSRYYVALDGDPCAYCGQRFQRGSPGAGRDHIVPKSRGGLTDWTNLTACCTPCNKAKRNASLLGFLMHRRLFPIWTALRAEAGTWRAI